MVIQPISARRKPGIWQCIAAGLPGHSGTGILLGFTLMGATAGGQRGSWAFAIGGAVLMLAVFGPMYLFGAYEAGRGKLRRKYPPTPDNAA